MGLIIWIAFSFLAVAVRGVRWDETYEHAQVITGAVAYPSWHPLFVYTRNAFSLQTYISAGLFTLIQEPIVLCAIRNILFLLATVLPPFLITTALTRNPLWGHAAALLILRGAVTEFDGSYPIAVWPHIFSNGHVGGGIALLILYLLMVRRWAGAFLLLGAMPAIHIGQLPPVLAVAACVILYMLWKNMKKETVRALGGLIAGLALTLLFWFILTRFTVPIPDAYSAFESGEGHRIWAAYTARYDAHRAFPPGNGHIVLVAMILLGLAAVYNQWRANEDPWPAAAIALYGLITGATVWTIMVLHGTMGENTPFLLIGWMPYRLINNVSPLLVCFTLATLAGYQPSPQTRAKINTAPLLIVFYAAAYPLASYALGKDHYQRYIMSGDLILFLLTGATCAVLTLELRKKGRPFFPWIGAQVLALAALASYHQLGALGMSLGFVATIALHLIKNRHSAHPKIISPIAHVLLLILGVTLLYEQGVNRKQLPIGEFNRAVKTYLDSHEARPAMVAAGPSEFFFQAQTGHPVFVESATASLISYMPSMAPFIQRMYDDLYGIRFDTPRNMSWQEVWQRRSPQQWQDLAEQYDIGYLAAPAGLSLNLRRAVETQHTVLYEIPNRNGP